MVDCVIQHKRHKTPCAVDDDGFTALIKQLNAVVVHLVERADLDGVATAVLEWRFIPLERIVDFVEVTALGHGQDLKLGDADSLLCEAVLPAVKEFDKTVNDIDFG